MARAASRLAPIPGLTHGRLDVGDAVIVWSAAADAPIDRVRTEDGMAVVFGDALARGATQRSTARAVSDAWTAPSPVHEPYDGFFAAVVVRDGSVVVGGDLLGLFPLYVASWEEGCIASSTPAAFDAHERTAGPERLAGLFEYLLTGGPLAGGTLRAGVRRLEAGARWRWQARAGAKDERVFEWPRAGGDAALTFDEQAERLHAAQDEAVRRHTSVHPRLSVLLSGGRDSRTLVGYLARQGRDATALSLGVGTDHDATCAAAVARTLGMPHRLHDVAFERFPEFADRTISQECLAGGLSSMHSWAAVDALRDTGGAVLSGYVFEVRQIAPLPASREAMLDWTHARALAPAALERLVRAPHRALVGEVMAAVRARFDALATDAEDDAEASWRWLMAGYARFHAGAVPWRLAFAAWPVLPILDRALLEVMCSIPREQLAARRMQDAVLRTRFPALARLPLDRNADDLRPLLERPWTPAVRRLRAGLRERIGSWRGRRAPGVSTPRVERRYYARMYDFDNPGWRLVRAAAEAGRAAAGAWFDPTALAGIVPPPATPAAHADPVAQGFAPKTLTGLMRMLVLRAERPA